MSQSCRVSSFFSTVLAWSKLTDSHKLTSPAFSLAAAAFSFRTKVCTCCTQSIPGFTTTLTFSTLHCSQLDTYLLNTVPKIWTPHSFARRHLQSLRCAHIINTTTNINQYPNKMAKSSYSAIEPKPFHPPMISPILIHDIDTPNGQVLMISLLEKLASPNLIGITVKRSPSPPGSSEPLNIISSIKSHPQPQPGLQAVSSRSRLPSSISSVDLCATPYIQVFKHCQPVTTVLMHIDPVRYVSDHSIGSFASMIHVSKEVAAQFRQLEDCKEVLQSAANVKRVVMYGKDESQMAVVGEMLVRWVREKMPGILMGRLQQTMVQDAEPEFSGFGKNKDGEDVDLSEFFKEHEDEDGWMSLTVHKEDPKSGLDTQV
ncbi:hypothetical protein FB567DRAFT_240552 [Paraphoma chrysanthemicola]|uniref:Uncharacterized protein n=1 Tax=Paraphoma chrysanthemicola TaxID=798071 RepID=A0A8K0RDX0_9PLEO|nr:hypothetical protein FB567DRAFT_240552 [Paraphoma chrysanthemicola]